MKKSYMFKAIMVIGIFLLTTEVNGADWKYFGGAKVPPKNEVAFAYYDAETVMYLSNGNVRFWSKTISKSKLDSVMKNNKNQIVEESAKKVVNRYFPPYALVTPKTSYNDVIDIISWEEAAKYAITPILKMYSEINCKEKKDRILSIIYFKNDAVVYSKDSPQEWKYISPESNMETLQKILCK